MTSFCDEDVPRLDVTVHDALRVKELALPACLRHAYEHHDRERVALIGTAQHSAKRIGHRTEATGGELTGFGADVSTSSAWFAAPRR